MKKTILIIGIVLFFNPLLSMARQFEISYNVGILYDDYITGKSKKTAVLHPEIRIGYELINNYILSFNYGYWDNNLESWRDINGVVIDETINNHTDNAFSILISKKNTNTFIFTPFIGCSLHILKSYAIVGIFGSEYEKKVYGGVDFGIKVGYRINNKLSVHLEAQGSKFLFDGFGIFLILFKTGVTLIR